MILEESEHIFNLVLATDEHLVDKVRVRKRFNRNDHQIIKWTLSVDEPMIVWSLHKKFNYFIEDFDLIRIKLRGKDLEGGNRMPV